MDYPYEYSGSSSSLSSGTGSASDIYGSARPDKTYYRVQVTIPPLILHQMFMIIDVRRVLRVEGLAAKIKQLKLMMRKWEILQFLRGELGQPISNVVSFSIYPTS